MSAGRYDLYVEQGATFTRTLTIKNADGTEFDLTGYSAAAEIRNRAGGSLVSVILCTIDNDPTTGVIVLSLTSVQTKAFSVECGEWDLEIDDGAGTPEVTRVLEGEYHLELEVTTS